MLSVNEAAELIGVSPGTLRKYVKKNIGPPCEVLRLPSGTNKIFYKEKELEEWLSKQREKINGNQSEAEKV